MTTTSGSALLVMDLQQMMVTNHGSPELVGRIDGAVREARSRGALVVHVVVEFRPGYPEVAPVNRMFAGARGAGLLTAGDPATAPHPGISREPADVTVTKRRVSAFHGTDLDVVLRANDVRHVALAGIATSGVVLSTVRDAADRDYGITVLEDCCADRDQDLHRVLMEKVFPVQAVVAGNPAWLEGLAGDAPTTAPATTTTD